MAKGTGLHIPAALPVSHGQERLPEQCGWHRPPLGPPLGTFGPSPSPERCEGLARTILQCRWPCLAGDIIQEIGVQRHAGPSGTLPGRGYGCAGDAARPEGQ